MIDPSKQTLLSLYPNDEIIVDLFAGGGGASTGIEMALGRRVDVAINHDPVAIAIHEANHPETEHYQSDVFEVDPATATKGRPVGLLWMSPDCTYYSRARGAKPIRHANKKRRALAWVAHKWAARARPRVIMLENVQEFLQWGPLVAKRDKGTGRVLRFDPDAGKKGAWVPAAPGERVPVEDQLLVPDKARAGETFRAWARGIEAMGYALDWRVLNAKDYGAGTRRARLFIVARRDGEPVVWPEPTHAKRGSQTGVRKRDRLPTCSAAADHIDFSLPMLSIFATAEEAREHKREHGLPGTPRRPLAKATMKRCARGVIKHVLEADDPYLVPPERIGGALAAHIQRDFGQGIGHAAHDPLGATTAGGGGHSRLVGTQLAPVVGTLAHGEGAGPTKRWGDGAHAPTEPTGAITASGGKAVIGVSLAQTGYGEREGQAPRVLDPHEPAGAIVASGGKVAAVAALLTQNNGGFYDGDGRSLRDPASPILTSGSHNSLVAAHLVKNHGTSHSASAEAPVGAILASGQHHSLVAAHLVHNYTSNTRGGDGDLRRTLKTITTGTHAALVYSFLLKYYGTSVSGQDARAPLHTVGTRDTFGVVLVVVNGETYVMTDILLRMLTPRELFNCQGMPKHYVIDTTIRTKKRTRTLHQYEQVRLVGNSVSPPPAAALVAANVPEMAVSSTALAA